MKATIDVTIYLKPQYKDEIVYQITGMPDPHDPEKLEIMCKLLRVMCETAVPGVSTTVVRSAVEPDPEKGASTFGACDSCKCAVPLRLVNTEPDYEKGNQKWLCQFCEAAVKYGVELKPPVRYSSFVSNKFLDAIKSHKE